MYKNDEKNIKLNVLSIGYKRFLIEIAFHYLFTSCFDKVLEENESLIHMSPIFAVVVESFPNHLHDFRKSNHIIR